MSAQDAELVAAWQRARKGPQGMAEELDRVRKKGKDAGQEVEDAFKKAVEPITKLGTAMGIYELALKGASTFHQIILKELEAIKQRRQEAFGYQVDAGKAQRKMFDALGPGADLSPAQLQEIVGKRTAIPGGEYMAVVGAALKERGNISAVEAEATANAVAEQNPHLGPEELSELARGAITLRQGNASLTAQQAAAQLSAATRASDSGSAEVAKVLPAAIGRMQKLLPGTSQGDLAAFVSRLEETQNEGIGSAAALAEKILVAMDKSDAKGTLNERLQKAARNPKILDAMKGSKYTALKDLLESGDVIAGAGGTPEEVLQRELAFQRDIAGQPGQVVPQLNRILEVGKADVRSNPERGIAGFRNKLINELVEFGGMKSFADAESFVDNASGDSSTPEAMVRGIQRRVANERQARLNPIRALPVGPASTSDIYRESTKDEQASAASLQKIEELMARMLLVLKDQSGKPLEVNVKNLPADTRPRPSGSAALNDRK